MIICNKATIMPDTPPCTRFATQTLELEAAKGPSKGERAEVNVCDPCAGMLNRLPGVKVIGSTPTEPATPSRTRREHIEAELNDMITDLFYYDRKESEHLPVDAIEEAVKAGEITEEEIIEIVTARIHAALAGNV
jgi:hypothetical protein